MTWSKFALSNYSLVVIKDKQIIFSSTLDRLTPIIKAIRQCDQELTGSLVFDRVVGKAAALLLISVEIASVHSLIGSQQAVETLTRYRIPFIFEKIIPIVLNNAGTGPCPLEKLASNKTPEEFYCHFFKSSSDKRVKK